MLLKRATSGAKAERGKERMMDDLISRRGAINTVSEITTTMSVCTSKDECYGMKRMQKQAITELENMPSAEQEAPDINVGNLDAISRQQAFDALHCHFADGFEEDRWWNSTHVIATLKELPSVQPEHKTGSWIPVTNGRGGHQCDRCGSYAPSYQSGAEWLSNFCPECNADMRGEQ